jgi:sterol desaturase/sphingolipid hydroxylase (fatty acid hydroxylase superfamily)
LLATGPVEVWLVTVLPLVIAFSIAADRADVDRAPLAIGAAAGAAYWTFLEYAIHRWLYHIVLRRPLLRRVLHSLHLHHHKHLDDHGVLNAGPLLAYPVLALVLTPIAALAGPIAALAVGIGVALAYGVYEVIHYLIHLRAWRGGYLAWIQRFHLYHHERRWNRNFGNTSPLWDRLLGTEDRRWRTYRPSARVLASLIRPPVR